MKKLTYLLFLAIGVTACSVESIDSTENLLTADAKFKMAVATSVDHDEAVCLGDMANFTFNFPQAYNSNDKEQKTLVKLELMVNGEWVEIYGGNFDGEGPKYFSYDFGIVGTYQLQHRIGTGNNWTAISVTVEDCNPCENSLEVDLVCGSTNTATFTFTAEEAGSIVIQGGLTNGTTIKSASSNVLTRNTTHNGVVNSNSNVTRWEGDVEACEVVTVTVEFTGGEGIGNWTAKSGEDLLGETDAQKCN